MLKKSSIFLLACLFFNICYGQIQADSLSILESPLLECSGLIELDGHFITHNDSGDDAVLYEINSLTGEVIRTVEVSNAHHIDWEDICHDDDYIYVSDSGNNQGVRTDLKVYKILIDDFFNTPNESVEASVIEFAYADQTDFSGSQSNHNFDAEAIISINDSLYIFTKNRGDFRTNVYPLSKIPGNYQLVKTDSLNSQGLITGATYLADSAKVILIGYTLTNAFVIELSNVQNTHFSAADLQQYDIIMNGSFQMESIAWKGGDDFLVTTERNFLGDPVLYCLKLDIGVAINEDPLPYSIRFFPNPCNEHLFIDSPLETEVYIYDYLGNIQLVSAKKRVDTSGLINGIYWLKSINPQGRISERMPLIILH